MLCIWQIQSDFTYLASIHTLLENFENTAIFLPSTLTAVTKRSSNRRNLRKPHFCFRVNWTEHILKTELFENHGVMTIMWPPRLSVPYTKIQNNHWLLHFLKFPWHFMHFQSKTSPVLCTMGLNVQIILDTSWMKHHQKSDPLIIISKCSRTACG